MKGRVDTSGRALLEIELQPTEKGSPQAVAVWIDTGFTGDLVLPRALVEKLVLQQSGTVIAILADGSQVAMRTYTCFIRWFGEQLRLEVVANDGEYLCWVSASYSSENLISTTGPTLSRCNRTVEIAFCWGSVW